MHIHIAVVVWQCAIALRKHCYNFIDRAQEGFEAYEEKEGDDGIDSKKGPTQPFDRDRPAKYGTDEFVYRILP